MNETPLISLRRLGRSFHAPGFLGKGRETVQAVSDVDLDIVAGRTLGIVGESGCGKSTLGRMAVGLLEPSAGDVFIMGRSLYDRKAHEDYAVFRRGLAGTIQMIFQDPYSSLNPRMSIGQSVAEPLICARSRRNGAKRPDRASVRGRVGRMLEQVGLEAEAAQRYPHEFSGGQRQRIAIARALITSPAFVVCDEPTSSLDASVQSQVLNLLQDMQQELNLTYMFISHDLAVVRHMSDRVAVMYRGMLVETGASEDVFRAPCHPYTRLLLESVPGFGSARDCPGTKSENGRGSAGTDVPTGTSPAGQPGIDPAPASLSRLNGCLFAPRCLYANSSCREAVPELVPTDAPAPALCAGRASEPAGGEREATQKRGAERAPLSPDLRLVRCRLYKTL